MTKKCGNKNKGSAMLIAIVIMMVLTMLSLALLLVSYSLFQTVNKQQKVEQCTELARSLSRELEAEITEPEFRSYAQQQAASDNGEYPLWFYLRYNVLQSNWPYYDEDSDDRAHGPAEAFRHFTLEISEEYQDFADQISVTMYYKSDALSDQENTGYIDQEIWRDASVIVEVTCENGKQKSTVTTTYGVVEEEEAGEYDDAPEGVQPVDAEMNPSHNSIYLKGAWSWNVSNVE